MRFIVTIVAGIAASAFVISPAMAQTAAALATSSDLSLVGLGLFGAVLGQRAGRKHAA